MTLSSVKGSRRREVTKMGKLLFLSVVICLILAITFVRCDFPQAQSLQVPPEELPEGSGAKGGTITMDLPSEPETLNPIIAQGEASQAVTSLINGTLFEYPRQPALVKAYSLSVDGKTLTLILRKGIKFSDGEPMTCRDVDFTFNDVVFNQDIAGAKEVWKLAGQFPEVECVSKYKVTFSTPDWFAGLIDLLARQPILPRHLLADKVHKLNPDVPAGNFNSVWGVNTPPDQIAGLGPFRLQKYVIGQEVVLERNPHYWKVDPNGAHLPYLEKIILPIVRDDSVRVLRYLNCQTDLLRPRPEDIQSLIRRGSWVEVRPAGVTNSNVFVFNQDVKDPALRAVFRSLKFRQAMSQAADRETMIALSLSGYGKPRYGPGIAPIFRSGCQGQEDFPRFTFNLKQADQILDDLGLRDIDGDGTRNITDEFLTDHTVSLDNLPQEKNRELRLEILTVQGSKTRVTDAEVYKDTLQKLGLKVVINPVPVDSLRASLQNGDYQVARVNFITNGDPNVLVDIYHSQGREHYWRLSDSKGEGITAWQKRVDEILMAQKTADGETRWDLMCEFQRLVAQKVPMVFLYNVSDILAFKKSRLGNFKGIKGKATIIHPEYLFVKK